LPLFLDTGYIASKINFSPIPVPGAGVTHLVTNGVETTILSGGTLDDGYWSGITLPYNFNFYGNTFSSLVIRYKWKYPFWYANNRRIWK
jgi:hypothetical protein